MGLQYDITINLVKYSGDTKNSFYYYLKILIQ